MKVINNLHTDIILNDLEKFVIENEFPSNKKNRHISTNVFDYIRITMFVIALITTVVLAIIIKNNQSNTPLLIAAILGMFFMGTFIWEDRINKKGNQEIEKYAKAKLLDKVKDIKINNDKSKEVPDILKEIEEFIIYLSIFTDIPSKYKYIMRSINILITMKEHIECMASGNYGYALESSGSDEVDTNEFSLIIYQIDNDKKVTPIQDIVIMFDNHDNNDFNLDLINGAILLSDFQAPKYIPVPKYKFICSNTDNTKKWEVTGESMHDVYVELEDRDIISKDNKCQDIHFMFKHYLHKSADEYANDPSFDELIKEALGYMQDKDYRTLLSNLLKEDNLAHQSWFQWDSKTQDWVEI